MTDLDIGGIQYSSTIDYPGEMVSVLFFCRCSFQCPFCQNWSLVLGKECNTRSVDAIVADLIKYRKYITGICVTGGEPTLQLQGLIDFFENTHKQGLLNKLDTNGFYPDRIERLLSLKLLNYAAIDVKSSLNAKRYGEVIGMPHLGETAFKKVVKTIQLFTKFDIPFETRTTIVPTFIDTPQEIEQIAKQLNELKVSRYILQQFRPDHGTLNENFSKLSIADHDLLIKLAKVAKKFISDVRTRSIEAGEERT